MGRDIAHARCNHLATSSPTLIAANAAIESFNSATSRGRPTGSALGALNLPWPRPKRATTLRSLPALRRTRLTSRRRPGLSWIDASIWNDSIRRLTSAIGEIY